MSWAIYLEEGIIKVEHLSAHKVLSADSTEDNDITPNALITKDTNTTVRVKTGEGLGDLNGMFSLHSSWPM
jgi:hypothetical protein